MIGRIRNFIAAAGASAAAWAWVSSALAQFGKGDSKWIDPAVDTMWDVGAGGQALAAPALGLFILGLGFWAGFTGRMDWGRAGTIVLAGFLIVAGGGVVWALLS